LRRACRLGDRPDLGIRLLRDEAIREQAQDASHPDVAQILHNLAIVYKDQGKYGEAEGLYKRTLTITEKAKGASPPTWPRLSTT
jgi:tetratricopeptide (TPR) repeat protein